MATHNPSHIRYSSEKRLFVYLERSLQMRFGPSTFSTYPSDVVLRSLCIIAIVAFLSAALSHIENAHGERHSQAQTIAWVRTVDGWEPSSVLTMSPRYSPTLHPSLVAGFLLTASILVLVAFPYRASAS